MFRICLSKWANVMNLDPRDAVLLNIGVKALDLVIALQPPAYGGNLDAHASEVEELESLIATLRRSRRPSLKPPLPTVKEAAQLRELSGRQFAQQRQQVAKQLQGFIDALNDAPRNAPGNVHEAIQRIARRRALPIMRDADEAWRAFHAGSFKASVVMAGATLEGALQAAVERLGSPVDKAYRSVYPNRKTPGDSDNYRFEEALAVLKHMGVLTSAVSHVARGVKELRNYVHPAVQKRQRSRVTDTRALLALQAVAALLEEMAERIDTD